VRETVFLVGLALLTSAVAGLIARRGRPARAGVGAVVAFTLEALGLAALFLVANVGLGVILGIASRTLGVAFFPLYLFADWTFAAVSLVQGVAFRRWLGAR
jgi:hypothetical protein